MVEVIKYGEIPGFTGYRVTSDGRVQSRWARGDKSQWVLSADKWRDLKLQANKKRSNYLQITMRADDGRKRTKRVSVLVMLVFHGACPKGMEVCHEDGNNHNNRLDNLRYDTPTNNHKDKAKHGTLMRGERCWAAVATESVVREIRRRVAGGESRKVLAKEFHLSRSALDGIVNRVTWKHVIQAPADDPQDASGPPAAV